MMVEEARISKVSCVGKFMSKEADAVLNSEIRDKICIGLSC